MNVIAHPLAALALLASLSAAQAPGLPPAPLELRRHESIDRVVHLVYDVATERIRTVRVSSPNDLELGGQLCFDNSALWAGIAASVVAQPGQDLLNWGRKFCRGSGLLRSVTISYVSRAVDVNQGGPGGALSMALFTGTAGFGQPGTEIFRRTLTGLPSDGFSLFVLTFDFTTDPLPVPDGAIGWSFLQIDSATGPVLVEAPNNVLRTLDAMDLYGPGPARAGNYLGTFNYGGCESSGFPCANTWIQLDEIANSELAVSAELNGTGVNPQVLHEALPARLGHLFVASVDGNPPAGTGAWSVLLASHAPAGPTTTRYGEVLIDLSQQVFPPLAARGTYSFLIPADQALVGRRIYLQAALLPVTTFPLRLTNALRVRIGY